MKIECKINMAETEKGLFFLIGLTSTWTALQVPIIGVQISIFNVIVIVAAIFHYFKVNHRCFYVNDIYILLFLIGTVISCVSCLLFLNQYWFKESFKATMKFLLVFFPLLCLYKKNEIKHLGYFFYIGLYYSCIIQLIWSILQLIFWYGMNRVLNEEFFGEFLHIQTTHSWLTWHSGFRTTGLSWESANLGISLVIGYFLSDNIWLKMSFLIGLIFCGSRSALLTLLFSIFATECYRLLFVNNHISYRKKKLKKFLQNIVIIIIIAIVMLNVMHFDFSIFFNTISTFFSRIVKGFSGDDASAGRHIDYYLKLHEVFRKSNLFQLLFGYGTSCSGYPYTEIFNKSTDPAYIWNVESDIITILVGNGIFGFVTYYIFALKILYNNRKNKFDQLASVVCIVFAGIMYLYIRTWVTLVLVFMAADAKFPKYRLFNYKRYNLKSCISKLRRRIIWNH